MILASAKDLKKSFGTKTLFDGITFVVESGDHIGLIGPNGSGKSTLLKMLSGQGTPDEGALSFQRGLKIGFLEQNPALLSDATVWDCVAESCDDPYSAENSARIQEFLARLELNTGRVTPETPVKTLSGGWKKRVALARELVKQPDLLLLDEPTNHLDLESILWLEDFLANADFAVLVVTHDRLFLQKVSQRLLELDKRHPGGILDHKGDYASFLERKEGLVQALAQQEVSLKNKLRRETEWLRRGAKARTTKQQARITRAEDLKDTVETLSQKNRTQTINLEFQASDKKPKRLIEAKQISKSYGTKTLFKNLDLFIGPKTRIGFLGVNGCGKSTLIRALVGQEAPDSGTILRADQLKVAYFEQNRDSLDPQTTLMKTLCPHGEEVLFRGRMLHIRSYLDRFLFSREQADTPVGRLSGGEQARVLIARLMLQEASVLVLDEPTNDLDIETLDVLQECLTDFEGAVLLVSHDRYFMDQTATEIVAFPEAPGQLGQLVTFAGLDQWEGWRDLDIKAKKMAAKSPTASDGTSGTKEKKRKLSYKEQRELESMEKTIADAEATLKALEQEAGSADVQTNSKRLTELYEAIAKAQQEVERLYARWQELENG